MWVNFPASYSLVVSEDTRGVMICDILQSLNYLTAQIAKELKVNQQKIMMLMIYGRVDCSDTTDDTAIYCIAQTLAVKNIGGFGG